MRRITKLGSLLVGVAAGAAAVVWVIKDRLLGPETAPVSRDRAPAFRVAPREPADDPPADGDDLSGVKGIGPVYRARLEDAGITTFAGMVAAGAERVAEAADVSPDRAKGWVKQARTIAR